MHINPDILADRVGREAADYALEHCIHTGDRILVAHRYETPASVVRALTRAYGRPQTIGRGEVAYWEVSS